VPPPVEPYARADLDELLDFGSKLAQKTPDERAAVCRDLLSRPSAVAGPGFELHRMIGGLLSDDCGDTQNILEKVEAISPGSLPDERVRRLVAMQSVTLRRMVDVTKRLDILKRKQRALKGAPQKGVKPAVRRSNPVEPQSPSGKGKDAPRVAAPAKSAPASPPGDDRLLRQKLEAIRDMERQLDQADEVK
jgi:hypothetical protein